MKIKYLILLLIAHVPSFLIAQSLLVVDDSDQQPIAGVSVLSESPRAFTYTDGNGRAELSAFGNARQIELICQGYESFEISMEELKQQAYKVSLIPVKINLEEVFVSATRWQESSGNVPQRIIGISPKDISFHNPQTAADLLGMSGKVFIQKSQQGGGSPMIRGFATNRLIYSVDGVRMNTAIFRSGNIQNVINLDPFAMEQVEVIFGPGSVMYGSDAIGGVMSFRTLESRFSNADTVMTGGKFVARYSSANREKSFHADAHISAKKWAFVTSVSHWDYDHLRQGSRGPDDYLKPQHIARINGEDALIAQEDPLLQVPSAYEQYNIMQKIAFRPNEQWKMEYGLHYSETSPYGRYDRHNRSRRGLPRYGEWSYGPQIWEMNILTIEHQQQNSFYDLMSIKGARQRFEESRISRDLRDSLRTIQAERLIAWSVNMDFSKSTGEKNTLYYGLEGVVNEVSSRGTEENILSQRITEAASRYPQSVWNTLSVYVNDEFRLNPRWTFQSGLRYAFFGLESQFDTAFYPLPFQQASLSSGALTGSFGVVHRAGKNWILRSNLGTAFRAPNVDDMGKVFDSEPGAVTVPNPDLRSEYAWNADVSVARLFGDFLKLELSAFYTRLDGAMVRRNALLQGMDSIVYLGEMSRVQSVQNAAMAEVFGVQGSAELRLNSGMYVQTDYSYQRGTEELGDGSVSASRHAAPAFGIIRLGYRKKRLLLECNAPFQAEVSHAALAVEERSKTEIYALDNNGQTYVPAWITCNVRCAYDYSPNTRISTGLENVLDRRYRAYSSGISGAGRNFVMSITARF